MVADTRIYPPLVHRNFLRTRSESGVTAAVTYLRDQIGSANLRLKILNAAGAVKMRVTLPAALLTITDDRLYVPTPHGSIEVLEALNLGNEECTVRVGKNDDSVYLECPIGLPSNSDRRMKSSVNLDPANPVSLGTIVFGFSPPGASAALVPIVADGYRLDDPLYRRLWGPGLASAAKLAPLDLGRTGSVDKAVSLRIRMPFDITLTRVGVYLPASPLAAGTGGHIRIAVYPDLNGLPDTSQLPVSSGGRVQGMSAGGYAPGFGPWDLISMINAALVGGRIYHFVFTNADSAPDVNYTAIQSLATSLTREPADRWARATDKSVLFGTKAPADPNFTWADYTSVGDIANGLRYSPILTLESLGGLSVGFGPRTPGERTSGTDQTYTRGASIRERIVPAATKVVTGFSLHAAASVAGDLQWNLMQGDTVIESGVITQSPANYSTYTLQGSTYADLTWYDVPFSAARTLNFGQTYYLTFGPVAPAVWRFAADAHVFQWISPAAAQEFQAQQWNGTAWRSANPEDHATENADAHWRVVLHEQGITVPVPPPPPPPPPPPGPATDQIQASRVRFLMESLNQGRFHNVQAGNDMGWNDTRAQGSVVIGPTFRHSTMASQSWYDATARQDNRLCRGMTSWFVVGEEGTGPLGGIPTTNLNQEPNAAFFLRLLAPAYGRIKPGYPGAGTWVQLTYNNGVIHCDLATKTQILFTGQSPPSQALAGGVYKFKITPNDPYIYHGAAIRTQAAPSGNQIVQDVFNTIRGNPGPGLPGIDWHSKLDAMISEVWEAWIGPWDLNAPFNQNNARIIAKFGGDPFVVYDFIPGYLGAFGMTSLQRLTTTPQKFAFASLREADNSHNGYSVEASIPFSEFAALPPPSVYV